jgi:predicted transcriptional regulator
VGKLAATLGVSRRTIDRWGAGTIPNRHVQEYVIQEAKKLGVTITWI